MGTTGLIGQQLRLRLFLEGIEVPVIAAQVQINLNSPATSSIQVIPTDKAMDLKARTMVHLFYADIEGNTDSPPTTEEVDEPKDPIVGPSGYKLLFGGEVVGLVMGRSPTGRQTVLQCADWSSYWDSMYQVFLNQGRKSQYSGDEVQIYGGGSQTMDNVISSPKTLKSYLKKKPVSPGLQKVNGLMGGVISLIEAMGGSPKNTSGVSDFFTIAELKNHLLQQIVCEQDDDTAQRLFNSDAFSSWLTSRTASLGGLVNLRTIMRLLFHWIYYETVPVTCPMYVPPKAVKPYLKRKKSRPARSYVNREQRIVIKQQIKIAERFDGSSQSKSYTIKNQITAPQPNLIAEMIKKLDSLLRLKTVRTTTRWDEKIGKYVPKTTEYEGGGGDVTITKQRDFNRSSAGGKTTVTGSRFDLLTGRASLKTERQLTKYEIPSVPSLYTGVLSPEARVHIKKARDHLESVRSNKALEAMTELSEYLIHAGALRGGNLRSAEELKKLDFDTEDIEKRNKFVRALTANSRQWKEVSKELYRALGIGGRAASSKLINDSEVDRLYTQIFRPDCFFVAPPKCNVLFPEQYTGFQFQRNFLQEITRLRLTTGLKFKKVTSGKFFESAHFAPSKKDILDIAKDLGSKGYRTVLPWEQYSGVLPKFEHIAHVEDSKSKKEKELRKGIEVKSYIQRAANFNFFKYRFAPRVLSISGRFLPQFAPGFPALVITEPFVVDPAALRNALNDAGIGGYGEFDVSSFIGDVGTLSAFFQAPLHYLGMPASMSHSVGQDGGATNMTLTHARSHRTADDDFLKLFEAQSVKRMNTKRVRTDLDAEKLLRDGDYKKIKFLIDCTNQESVYEDNHSLFYGKEPEDDPDDLLALNRRPTGAPNFAGLSQVSPYVFNNATPGYFDKSEDEKKTEFRSKLEAIEAAQDLDLTSSGRYHLTGQTAVNPLSYAPSTTITEPLHYGKIKPGSKGLNRKSKVLHVQVLSNQIIAVRKEDINKFVKSKKDRKALRKSTKGLAKSKFFFMWKVAVVHEEVDIRITTSKSVYSGKDEIETKWTGYIPKLVDKQGNVYLKKAPRKDIGPLAVADVKVFKSVKKKKIKVGGKVYSPIPIEESIRPSWFCPLYSNFFIGEFIYQKFFGTGALVDQALFMTPDGDSLFGSKDDKEEMLAKVRAADGDSVKITQILEDAKGSSLSAIPGIEESADALAYIYGEVRRQNLDVQGFITNYTSRPIATMTDIFGSSDLEYKEVGQQLDIETGTGGFHSTAVAPFDELLGLIDNPDLELARLSKSGRKYPVSRALDPRPGRRAAVMDYAAEVSASGSSLAVGLPG